jgi:hypothetical protein
MNGFPILSYPLWRAFFKTIPRHPLFWLYARRPRPARPTVPPPDSPERRRQRIRELLVMFTAVIVGLLTFIPLILTLSVAGLLLPLLVSFGGLFAGLQVALSVTAAVSDELDRRGAVVAVTADGLIGLAWAAAAHRLRTDRAGYNLRRFLRVAYLFTGGGALLTGTVWGLLTLLTVSPDGAQWQITGDFALTPFNAVLIVAALYVELHMALVSGVLIGLTAPTTTTGRSGRLTFAFVGFAGAQVLFYALAASCVLITELAQGANGYLLTLARVALILTAREAVNYALWLVTSERLNTDWDEVHMLFTARRV